MKKSFFFIIFLFFLSAHFFAQENFSLNINLNFGPSNTVLKEILYNKGGKDKQESSLLCWESYALPSFETDVTLLFFQRFYANISAKYVIPAFSGIIQDYDNMNLFSTGSSEQTHYSKHENSLDNYYKMGLNLGYSFNPISRIKITPFLSLKYSYFGFTCYNGFRQYGTKIGEKNEKPVYTPWNTDIPKTFLDGKIITLEEESLLLGLGSEIDFIISDNLKSSIKLLLLPSLKSNALDTHHRRSSKYTIFEETKRLELDSSFMIQYKISKNHRLNLKAVYDYSFANNIKIYQSQNKEVWFEMSNPGSLKQHNFTLAAGYTYYYEK